MIKTLVNPKTLPRPRGYNHAVRVWPCGRMLFIAGQIGCTQDEKFVSKDVLGQFGQALANLQVAAKAGGGRLDDIVQMRIYVTDMDGYRRQMKELGKVWREFFGGYYPAITLLEVKGLLDDRAKVEIEAVAVLPLPTDPDDRDIETQEMGMTKPAAKAPPPPVKRPAPPPPRK